MLKSNVMMKWKVWTTDIYLISIHYKNSESNDKETKDCQCPQVLGQPHMNNELYIYNYSSQKCIFLCGVNGTVHHSQMQLQFYILI